MTFEINIIYADVIGYNVILILEEAQMYAVLLRNFVISCIHCSLVLTVLS